MKLSTAACFLFALLLISSGSFAVGTSTTGGAVSQAERLMGQMEKKAASAGTASVQAGTGAAPEPTQAEMILKSEETLQKRIAGLTLVVEDMEKRASEMRVLSTRPAPDQVDRLTREVSVAETELADLLPLAASPLAQLQRAQLQDRLAQIKAEIDLMKHRWGSDWIVFGRDYFENSTNTRIPDQRSVPSNYRIRVGDRLRVATVSSLGSRNEYHLTVDANGGVTLPGAGRVVVRGRTAAEFEALLSDRISSRFKQLRVEAEVEGIAPVQVQVAGEVVRPGTYVLDGLGTVLSALYQAGGPAKSGTFRKLSLVRRGEPKRMIDLYDFLLKGSNDQDLPLQDGDMLFVPPVGPTLSIDGEVVRPARYEPDFPITLSAALKMAGGAKASGYLQTVQVERVESGRYKVLFSEDISTSNGKAGFQLHPGDQVIVSSVRQDRTNQVDVVGPVAAPGIYGFSEGMRVADLVKLAQGFAQGKEVYPGRADILRVDALKGTEILSLNLEKALSGDETNNLLLRKLDRLFIYEPDQVVFRPRLVNLAGAVATAGTYRRTDGMRVSDVIAAAGGVLPQAYLKRADLLRYRQGGATELVKIDLQAALNGNPDANVLLWDRDEIMVYTQQEAVWQDHTVRVEGAVQRPGVYVRSENMRVSDLLFACGGTLPEAGPVADLARCGDSGESLIDQVDVASLSSGGTDPLLQDRDVLTVPSVNPSLRNPEIVYITGEVCKPGPYALASQRETLADLIARAGGLTENADTNSVLFLRQKEGFENAQQEQDADIILEKTRLFADKQFLSQLAKMGVKLPDNFLQAGNQSVETLSKPAEVVQGTVDTVSAKEDEGRGDQGNVEDILRTMAAGTPEQKEPSAMGPPLTKTTAETPAVFAGRNELAAVAKSARISVNLDTAIGDPASPDNLVMRNGDQVFIPKVTNVVTVIGAVLHPHAFAAGPGKSVDYYIERSGGFAQDASKGDVIVVRGNGEALPKAAVRSVVPGDMIVVPNTGLIDISKKWERTGGVTKVISDILSSVFILTRF